MATKRKMSIEDRPAPYCLLNPGFGCADRDGKADTYCQKCGWNKTEAERRRALIRSGGLTKDSYGARRLVIRYEM